MTQVKVGMVMVSDGKSRPQSMRLQLTGNMLILQKEEIIGNPMQPTPPCAIPPADIRERTIKIVRQRVGGLGLSIKGGAENKLPILVSRIFKDQAADQTGQLFVGDAILKVNDVSLENVKHDDAVNILRSAGDDVVLHVKHYRAATPFLSKSLQRQKGKHGGNNVQNRIKDGEANKIGVPAKMDRHWVDVMAINLLMAYLTRFMLETDKLRPNAFEIKAHLGKPSAVIHCDDPRMLSEWIKHISYNILQITAHQMQLFNKSLPVTEQIFYFGWVSEGFVAAQPWYRWRPKFLALKGSEIFLFEFPPTNLQEFGRHLCAYRVYQCMFRTLKESEYVDERQHCFLLQTAAADVYYLSVETRADFLRIENAWHRTTYNAVNKLGSKTFSVIHKGKTGGLTLDWNTGFSLYDTEAKSYVWKYKFSQLKSSSDDGKSKLKLVFNDTELRGTETKELECLHLLSLLYCMHAFLTGKIASVDPTFLRTQLS